MDQNNPSILFHSYEKVSVLFVVLHDDASNWHKAHNSRLSASFLFFGFGISLFVVVVVVCKMCVCVCIYIPDNNCRNIVRITREQYFLFTLGIMFLRDVYSLLETFKCLLPCKIFFFVIHDGLAQL